MIQRLDLWVKRFLIILFGGMIAYLFVSAIFSTCYMDRKETTLFASDNPFIQLGMCATVIFVALIVSRYKINYRRIFLGILVCVVVFLTIWVLAARLPAVDDPGICVDIAEDIMQGDYSTFERGGYLFRCPYQFGLVLLYCLIRFVAGNQTVIAIQLLNVALIGVTIFYLRRMAYLLFEDENISYITGIAACLFLPMMCYATFTYGNIPGLALSTISFYYLLEWNKSSQMKHLVCMAVFIMLAIMLRTNYLIALIAELLFLIWQAIRKRNIRNMLGVILLIAGYVLLQGLLNGIAYMVTGACLPQGAPKLGYFAMGLQESRRAAGWYNGFCKDIFVKNNYDYDIAYDLARTSFIERIKEFSQNRHDCIIFFCEKVNSLWNNPAFQGVWVVKRQADVNEMSIASTILNSPVKFMFFSFENVYHTLILCGNLCYIFVKKKKESKEFLPLIFFIGGFLFYLLWEAKGQYTFNFFVIIIPYAIMGYSTVISSIRQYWITCKEKSMKGKAISAGVIVCCILCVLLFVYKINLSEGNLIKKSICMDEDTSYISEQKEEIF